ncbi:MULTISPECIES: flagellar basal body-associated FliL family protein [unclassified Roseitalea]|uniref:flagellar basal body-associated FliL family protein n=1 Tax=unclassified Roseitalea TaxID=2639107 RepID=UPI00273F6560|nr:MULTISPECIES: flagellar basal body-associated FliL family protein [unclassified Roseitalea]
MSAATSRIDTDDDDDEQARSSPLMTIALIALAALIAGGAGFGAGKVLFAPLVAERAVAPAQKPAVSEAVSQSAPAVTYGAEGPDLGDLTLMALEPVMTNLAAPAQTWVRGEFTVALEGAADEMLAQELQADIVAYLRTVRLQSVSQPSGFQHLVADLEDRAALRSGGRVKRVFVRALLFE